MTKTDYGKSVRARLLSLSKKEKYDYQLLLVRYIQERLLYRLSQSRFKRRFFLKGGALLYAYERLKARPTLDIDFLADRINRDKENIKSVFKEVCSQKCLEDGVSFDISTLNTQEITVNKEYHGVHVTVTACLDTIRQPVSMDIGFGDIIVPKAMSLDYPMLLDTMPKVNVMAYSLETVVAEKFQAMISLAGGNSRMKDFFDVYNILARNAVNKEVLSQAIQATFQNRKTIYVSGHELFTEEFVSDPFRNAYWISFLRRIKYKEDLPFSQVVGEIASQLTPYWEQLKDGSDETANSIE